MSIYFETTIGRHHLNFLVPFIGWSFRKWRYGWNLGPMGYWYREKFHERSCCWCGETHETFSTNYLAEPFVEKK